MAIWGERATEALHGLHDSQSVFLLALQQRVGEGTIEAQNAVQLLHITHSFYKKLKGVWTKAMEPVCSTIKDMFLASPNFFAGLKIMLTSDNHLKNFNDTVAEACDISLLPPSVRPFLVDGTERLLRTLGERVPPRVIIPSSSLTGVSSETATKGPVPAHTTPEPVRGGGGDGE
jgi:hypothetical protein